MDLGKKLVTSTFRFALASHRHKKTVCLAGSPRSGTTWLAELLTKTGRRALISEPVRRIRRRQSDEANELGFSYRPFIDANKRWPEAERFLLEVFSGRRPEFVFWGSGNSLVDVLRCRQLVVKSISMNRMVPWILKHFAGTKTILLLRHPCAVVGSQLRFVKARATILHKDDERFVIAKMPHLSEYVQNLKTEEEIRAVSWCLDTIVPLSASEHQNLLVVTYEKLVTDGPSEIKKIFEFFAFDGYEKAVTRLGVSSKATGGEWPVDYRDKTEETRLARWKSDLSPERANRILEVVKKFNIRFYNESLEPDYEILRSSFQIPGIVG